MRCVTRSVKKREREESDTRVKANHGQSQTTIPMILILTKIFPYSFMHTEEPLHTALSIALTCKLSYHWFRERKEFWEPFLRYVINDRFDRMSQRMRYAMKMHYVMWPKLLFDIGGVIGVVQSKLLFEPYPWRTKEETKRAIGIGIVYPIYSNTCYYFSHITGGEYVEKVPFDERNFIGACIIVRGCESLTLRGTHVHYDCSFLSDDGDSNLVITYRGKTRFELIREKFKI